MNCPYPEHHNGSGGGWGGPIAAIFAAMVAAAVIGPMLHWLLVALACISVGAAVTVALVARKRWLEYQALRAGRYVPWLQPPQQFPGRQQPPAVQDGGQHLHLHLGGMTPEQVAEILRRQLP